MSGLIAQALSYFGDILDVAGMFVVNFFLDLFPNASNSVILDGFIEIINNHYLNTDTFNVIYFLDMRYLPAMITTCTSVVLVSFVVKVIRLVLDVVHKLLDSIPVIG